MAQNLTQITNDALIDLDVLVPGQGTTAQILPFSLRIMNEILDKWTMQRFNIYQGTSPTWFVLAQFPDVTTSYTFAPGNLLALRKTLAFALIPALAPYIKVAAAKEEQIKAEADEAVKMLQGVGPQ